MPRGCETVFYGTCYGADPVKHRSQTVLEQPQAAGAAPVVLRGALGQRTPVAAAEPFPRASTAPSLCLI